MHQRPIVLRSNAFNALTPQFLKHMAINILFLLPVIGLYFLIRTSADLDYDAEFVFGISAVILLISIIKLTNDIIRVKCTVYYVYPHHIEMKYSFISQESHSVQYKQITDLEVVRNMWDRMCDVGDIRIHTANDQYLSPKMALVLQNLKRPDLLKNRLNEWIHHSVQHRARG